MAGASRRIDQLLVDLGHFPTRRQAQEALRAGRVRVAGRSNCKPGHRVRPDVEIHVLGTACSYVSRGGLKLAHALEAFDADPTGRVCLDSGLSTGGFTDCLLRRGARRVIGVDVGYGQVAWSLRRDPRLVLLERTNLRHVTRTCLLEAQRQAGLEDPEIPALVTLDLSFISLGLVLGPLAAALESGTPVELLALVKPQFEAGPGRVGRGGIVRDPAVHEEALLAVARHAWRAGWRPLGLTPSPIRGGGRGRAGNREFFLWARRERELPADGWPAVAEAVAEAAREVVAGEGTRGIEV